MAWADLVVCRSGAMTVSELAAAGRPSILVPFGAAAAGHQLANARALNKAGAAIILQEKDLSAESLAGTVADLFNKRERLVSMSQKARLLAKPDAAKNVVKLVFEAEGGR